MQIEHFLKGVAIGFSIAVPVGPIGILCIRRTLNDGWWSGLTSGLGAATADMLYGSIAAFGIRTVSEFLLGQQMWIRIFGGFFLIFLGIRIILSNPSGMEVQNSRKGLPGAFFTTLILTLSNPLTIISFAAMFTGFDLVSQAVTFSDSSLMVMGVFLGSSLWWLILSGVVSILRARLNISSLKWINKISGGVITAFGIAIILSILSY